MPELTLQQKFRADTVFQGRHGCVLGLGPPKTILISLKKYKQPTVFFSLSAELRLIQPDLSPTLAQHVIGLAMQEYITMTSHLY